MKLSSNSNDMEGTVTASDEVTLKSSTRVLKFLPCSHRQDLSQQQCGYSTACFALLYGTKYISGEK